MTSSAPAPETTSRRRFELRKRIGSGAFGEVFLAEQVSGGGFRRPVALKLLNENAARMKEASRRMRDEARILGRLSHRHIVEVLDLVQIGDRWAVVMAYVPGADLEQVLAYLEEQGRAVPGPAACEIGAAVARALAAAWAATDEAGRPMRVVHRDIKPSNVRITEEAEIKVLDFGVARVELEGREAQTRRPALMGTERYMSPERLLLEGDGPPGDVYALAATVVELITGEPIGRSPVRDGAHEEFAESVARDLRAHLRGPEDVVAALLAVVRQSLAGDPASRPDAAAFARVMDDGVRRLEGDSLARFCAEVVTLAAGGAEASLEAATGTLFEGSGPPPPVVVSPTLIDEDLPPAAARDRAGAPRVVALLVGLVVLGLLGWQLAGDPAAQPAVAPDDAATTPAAAALPAPVLPPVAEPALDPPSDPAAIQPAAPDMATPPPRPSSPSRAAPKRVVETVTPAAIAPAAALPVAGPRVSRAMVVVTDVSGIEVACGDSVFHGTSSVRIVDFPAGSCVVRAERGGTWFRGSALIQAPREVSCVVQGDALECR